MSISLRARLVASAGAVAFIALASSVAVTYVLFSRSQLRQIDLGLQRAHEPIEQLVASEQPELERAIEQAAPGTFVALVRPDGEVAFAIPAREAGHEPERIDPTAFDDLTWPDTRRPGDADPSVFRTAASLSGEGDLRLRISQLADGELLFIGQPLHEASEASTRLLAIELAVATVALAVGAAAGWWLIRAGLRPLQRVEQTALAIAEGGELDHRAPGAETNTEVGRVAAALNTMLDRIRSAFDERDATEAELRRSEERMRRFVADVSHELRTPLAAVSAYAELVERGARSHPEDMDRALQGISAETGRMSELVEELLLLARLDQGRPLDRSTVDLAELLVEAIGTARTVAPDYPIALKVTEVVTVPGDARRLRQVVDNLLANVRTHTPAGTRTAISLMSTGEQAVIVVGDDGPGMDAEEAGQVFDRFYRADRSRSRESGGSGLGMAIVQALVTAHGGTVEFESSPGEGTTVLITLPRSVPPSGSENR